MCLDIRYQGNDSANSIWTSHAHIKFVLILVTLFRTYFRTSSESSFSYNAWLARKRQCRLLHPYAFCSCQKSKLSYYVSPLQCLRNGRFRFGDPAQRPSCARTGPTTRENLKISRVGLLFCYERSRSARATERYERSRRLNWSWPSSGKLIGQTTDRLFFRGATFPNSMTCHCIAFSRKFFHRV